MKKITQVTTAAILLSAIVSAGAFASDNKNSGEKSRPEISRTHQRNGGQNQEGENTNRLPRQMKADENAVIGQVKSVDAKNNKIKIADADGNVTEYAVTGFTKILSMKTPESKTENAKPDLPKPDESKSTDKKSEDAKTDDAKSGEAKSDGTNPRANFGGRGKSPNMNHGKPEFGPGQMMEELKLSDVKEGSWVMLSVLDGTTKTKQAEKIFVKAAE